MLHVILHRPEIPPNTGNVIRLCANTGAALHLVRPLGFELDDARLRRAGLDYHEWADVRRHASWPALLDEERPDANRMFAFTTHGTRSVYDTSFAPGDWLVFGCETRGLAPALRERFAAPRRLRLPMRPEQRSLNLSNAVAVAVFEAWRQNGFAGSASLQGAAP